jgi:hypothetical protein
MFNFSPLFKIKNASLLNQKNYIRLKSCKFRFQYNMKFKEITFLEASCGLENRSKIENHLK